ncbi:MAG: ATP-binding cassette domain-containing protein, partial [Eubacteriales bacterium]|nr:ATP-binding cassette domain-containing protein [Eubacteriales bacterium]
MDKKPIVELKNISKQFPGVLANDNISLSIQEGEVFAILGENGAGKSTLMNILFGLYRPDEGEIMIRGEKVELVSPRDASALGIGMVHQHFKLVQNYTIAQNIILGQEPKKRLLFMNFVDTKKAEQEIADLSRQYGLEVDPRQVISDINVSIRQRVEILKMLYRKADILILDEPTALLTPQEIDHLIRTIRELKNHGKTVILITHKLREIKSVADRCAVLRRGRLVDIFDVASTDTKEMATKM